MAVLTVAGPTPAPLMDSRAAAPLTQRAQMEAAVAGHPRPPGCRERKMAAQITGPARSGGHPDLSTRQEDVIVRECMHPSVLYMSCTNGQS